MAQLPDTDKEGLRIFDRKTTQIQIAEEMFHDNGLDNGEEYRLSVQ